MKESERRLEKPKILLVEDNNTVRNLAKMALSTDFEVHVAADGQAAREQLDKNKAFHAVLTDVSYPHGGADALLEHMRGHEFEPHRKVPVVFMSGGHGDDMEALRNQEESRGRIVDSVIKPFSPVDLIARLKTAVEKGRKPQ